MHVQWFKVRFVSAASRKINQSVHFSAVFSAWRLLGSEQGWARDVKARDRDVGLTSRDETETRRLYVTRRDRDVKNTFYRASICEGGLGSRNILSVRLSHAWIVTN